MFKGVLCDIVGSMAEHDKTLSPAEVQTRDDLRALSEDVQKAILAVPKQDTTFKVLKDPGERRSPGWPVATLSYVSYDELHKALRDPWVWGATVLGARFKGKIVCEWGFRGPDDREWSLTCTFESGKEVPKEKNFDWTVGGQGTDYDEFLLWLGRRLNRQLPVTPTDEDCTPPRMQGIVEVFGEVIEAPETVIPQPSE